jgi:hypothetical protein
MHAVRTSRFTWLCGASVAFSGYAFLVACTARPDQLPEVAAKPVYRISGASAGPPSDAKPTVPNVQTIRMGENPTAVFDADSHRDRMNATSRPNDDR